MSFFSKFFLFILFNINIAASDYVLFSAEKTPSGGIKIGLPENGTFQFFCDEEVFNQTKKLAIESPDILHKRNIEVLKPIKDILEQSHMQLSEAFHKQSRELYAKYQRDSSVVVKQVFDACRQSPLCFLQECTGGENLCPLSRKLIVEECPRANLEAQILASLSAQQEDNLNLVFYASGDGFFETILSLKLGNRIQTIVLIDPAMIPGTTEIIRNSLKGQKIAIDSTKQENCQIHGRRCIWLLVQILQFLARDNKRLQVFAYGSYLDYIADAENGFASKANLVAAIDYQDTPENLNDELDKEIEELFSHTAKKGALLVKAHSCIHNNELRINQSLTTKDSPE